MNQAEINSLKIGDTIQRRHSTGWVAVTYRGRAKDGRPIIEEFSGYTLTSDPMILRVQPKNTVKMYVQLFKLCDTIWTTSPCKTAKIARDKGGEYAIGEPQQIEVPEDYV